MKRMATICFLSFLAGCGSSTFTQDGINSGDKGSFVTISTDSQRSDSMRRGLDQTIVITSIDGENLFFLGMTSSFPNVLQVSPGVHQFGVQLYYLNMVSNGCLWVDSRLGENYIVKKKLYEYTVSFWVENIETHERVGGICGSEPQL
jgi:hypothetical protein